MFEDFWWKIWSNIRCFYYAVILGKKLPEIDKDSKQYLRYIAPTEEEKKRVTREDFDRWMKVFYEVPGRIERDYWALSTMDDEHSRVTDDFCNSEPHLWFEHWVIPYERLTDKDWRTYISAISQAVYNNRLLTPGECDYFAKMLTKYICNGDLFIKDSALWDHIWLNHDDGNFTYDVLKADEDYKQFTYDRE